MSSERSTADRAGPPESSGTDTTSDNPYSSDTNEDGQPDRADLEARIELLTEENDRLREAYRGATRTRHRRTAFGLLVVGALAVGGAVLFPDVRTVLLALGGTGVFAAVLTYFLTPERFLAASVSESVFGAFATNEATIAEELGLTDVRVYISTGGGARLFVPLFTEYELPDESALRSTFVVTDDEASRGLALDPTGGGLYESFEQGRSGAPPETPSDLARQLGDATVEQFELLEVATTEQAGDDRVVVGVGGFAYGSLTAFDHPVPSLFAVGIAREFDEAVTVAVETTTDDRYDALITCAWGN